MHLDHVVIMGIQPLDHFKGELRASAAAHPQHHAAAGSVTVGRAAATAAAQADADSDDDADDDDFRSSIR